MKLEISSIKFDADGTLLQLIQKKSDKLDTFFDRILNGEVNLSIDKNIEKGNKVIEMKIFVPGATLFAKESSKSFEEGIDLVIESLRKQLKKHKGKLLDRQQA